MTTRRYIVKDWMTSDPITICPNTTLPEANRLMRECRIHRLPVIENGRLVGIVTQSDIRQAAPMGVTAVSVDELVYLIAQMTVGTIMTPDPITVTPNTSIEAAARLMLQHKINSLVVLDDTRVEGIITKSDIFRLWVTEGEFRYSMA